MMTKGTDMNQIAPKVCENCQKAPATVRYDGEDLCRPCADYCAFRDIEEGDMEPGFGED